MGTSTLFGHIPSRAFISHAGNIPSRSSDAITDRKLPTLLSVVVAAGILSMPDPSAGTFHPSTLRRVGRVHRLEVPNLVPFFSPGLFLMPRHVFSSAIDDFLNGQNLG